MHVRKQDYRTRAGVSRRSDGESTLEKYIRVAAEEFGEPTFRTSLPLARPEIACRLSGQEYVYLLDILDELFLLEQAARFADRKTSTIARTRLIKAVSIETETNPELVETLFTRIDDANVHLIGQLSEILFPERPPICQHSRSEMANLIDNVLIFPAVKMQSPHI
jgi:hypothetical protein